MSQIPFRYRWRRIQHGKSQKVFHLFEFNAAGRLQPWSACHSPFDTLRGIAEDYGAAPGTHECKRCRRRLNILARERGTTAPVVNPDGSTGEPPTVIQ